MKIGIKTFSYKEGIEYFRDKADFIEIMALDDEDYSWLNSWKIPIVIHAQHSKFGVNPADKTKKNKTEKAIKRAIELANNFNSKKIIFHPGRVDSEDCSLTNSENLIQSLDPRIIIENLPTNEKGGLCTTPEETEIFLKKVKKHFCFDLNHSLQSSTFLKKEPYSEFKKFLKLKPAHYHIGGQKLSGEDHLSFEDSEIDLKKIFEHLPSDAEITLETSVDLEKVKRDLELIRSLVKNSTPTN